MVLLCKKFILFSPRGNLKLMTLALITLFGMIVGSFLNVCIYRVPRRISVTNPRRSYCPKCDRQLTWWENVPVLSWVMLRARCRTCKNEISGQYPLVELLSGVAAAASYVRFGLTPTGVLIYVILATLIVISFIDLEFKIIPDRISLPGIIIGLVIGGISQFTNTFVPPITHDLLDSVIGLLAGGGFFLVLTYGYYFMTGRVGLGGGDVKLMALVGAVLGWRSIAPTIFAGSLLGSVVGVTLMVFSGGGRHTEIPFGPWLAAGVVIHIFGNFDFFHLG